jgi:membrane-associated phospholipid phosphatase
MNFAKRFERQIRFLQNRLSPEGYAGLHLTVGVFVVLIAGWAFGEIGEDLASGDPLVRVDQQLAAWFHEQATPAMIHFAKTITFFGSVAWLGVSSVCLLLFFISRRAWLNSFLVALTMGGGSALNILLKHFFHRQRQVLENPLVTLSSYGFPSGHTMGATLFYGLLALLIAALLKSRAARVLCFFTAALITLLVGLTRIYLGAHYLSDILGAIAAGVLWLAVCWTAVEILRRRRAL